eukprot:TRINITY_DN3471_c0_g1_i1.p1 TRINITY_DN3471_c0_g1~~TRINITY_DN3471_c0_g1_i1.p1  ORF type:complete len:128 (+),score=37.52 TRINITY_DN3471_c0_g1_i1:38-421(+)
MLAKEEEAEAEVTWEDQQKINSFGRLTNIKHELQVEAKNFEEVLENLSEAESEIILSEEPLIKYFQGEVYISVPKEQAEEMIAAEQEKVKKQIDAINIKLKNINETLSVLKLQLKSKFKDSINLEEK